MNLRIWTHSTSNGGARGPTDYRFLDGLLHRGSPVMSGMAISIGQVEEKGISCIRMYLHLPQVYHSTGGTQSR